MADVLATPHELDGSADLLYTGRGSLMWLQDLDAWAAVLRRLLAPDGPPGASSRATRRNGCSTSTRMATGSPPTTTTSPGPEASKGWAPEYIDRLSVADDDQHWKFARAWTLGEIVTALLGAGLRLDRVAEHPTDWWGGHADVAPEERGRVPLSFSVLGGLPRRLRRSARARRGVEALGRPPS